LGGHVYYATVVPRRLTLPDGTFPTGYEAKGEMADPDYACAGCQIAPPGNNIDAKDSPFMRYLPGISCHGCQTDWWYDYDAYPNAIGLTMDYSRDTGNWASFSFEGTRLEYVYLKWPHMGAAHIYIDDWYIETLDMYDANGVWQPSRVYTGWLSSGAHTIAIEVSGQKHPASSDYFVVIDGFHVN